MKLVTPTPRESKYPIQGMLRVSTVAGGNACLVAGNHELVGPFHDDITPQEVESLKNTYNLGIVTRAMLVLASVTDDLISLETERVMVDRVRVAFRSRVPGSTFSAPVFDPRGDKELAGYGEDTLAAMAGLMMRLVEVGL